MVSEQGSAPAGVARRERQRLRVLEEIKAAAFGELRERGTAGVTMRAVARAIEITPSGLYRYVDGHDALLGLLASDALGDLADRIESAQAGVAQDTHATRWFVGCLAMRQWSLEHPAEYGLIFDTEATRGRPRIVAQSGNRAFLAFRSVCADALADREIEPDRTLLGELGTRVGDDPVSAADLLAATGIACLVGHLSIEIGGRIGSPLTTQERYPIFVRAVMRLLGFTAEELPDVNPPRGESQHVRGL
ncbi:putative TetR-family transcriptional regulator [Janibacter sp. HTCC2649]|uniref:TetR/AcrR family transcriptional regulator n=1 Tax=Janibacter sp. HTCC2649 TaxID=313589 RepID=UPI0000671A71|nr:TetR/AcrR family transcriptional regulator [Janibacter sp. HTCC2649]EAP98018.1 putative TetR-family transcriptional regulator [Janibacter sp. HTCC2649]